MNIVFISLMAFLPPFMMQVNAMPQSHPINLCQTDPHFNDWDFWVGDWIVYDNKSGKQAGTNLITKSDDGCVIKEDWTNMKGQKGFSMNYYNASEKHWRQIWVAAPGYVIDYKGGLNKDGAMVLEGYIQYYPSVDKKSFRGTWSRYQDGDVRQLFEVMGDDGTWTVWFDGRYKRK